MNLAYLRWARYFAVCWLFSVAAGDEERGITDWVEAFNNSSPAIRALIPDFYKYSYDFSGSIQNYINDGGLDMYDVGNKVHFQIGDGPGWTLITYNTYYRIPSVGVHVLAATSHPFNAMMWVGNEDRTTNKFCLKVVSAAGADGGGRYVSRSDSMIYGNFQLQYHSYTVYAASDPSITNVFYYISSDVEWNSTAPATFEREPWTAGTDGMSHGVLATGSPSFILIGFLLLSKTNGIAVTNAEERSVLTKTMEIVSRLKKIDAPDPCSFDNGGCSDVCTPNGYSKKCSCSLSCWHLDEDGKTCVPDMRVSCDGSHMKISIDACASSRTVVAGDSFHHTTQERCQSSRIGDHHVFNMPATTCGLKADSSQVKHHGKLWVWHGTETGSSTIIRGEYRIVPVSCTLNIRSNISASFVPAIPFSNETLPLQSSIAGFGNFSFYFKFYRTSEFVSAIPAAHYPISVKANDKLYFSMGAVGVPGFYFFAEHCDAVTSSSDPTQPPLVYTFIRQGCFIDSTLTRFPTNNTMEDRLSMRAFEFAEKLTTSRINAEIQLQCRVMICNSANETARCFRGCLSSSRQRRSLLEIPKRDADEGTKTNEPTISESPLQTIKGRFILIRQADKKNMDVQASQTPASLYWVLIAIGLAILLVVLFVSFCLLKSRRREIIKQRSDAEHNPGAE